MPCFHIIRLFPGLSSDFIGKTEKKTGFSASGIGTEAETNAIKYIDRSSRRKCYWNGRLSQMSFLTIGAGKDKIEKKTECGLIFPEMRLNYRELTGM